MPVQRLAVAEAISRTAPCFHRVFPLETFSDDLGGFYALSFETIFSFRKIIQKNLMSTFLSGKIIRKFEKNNRKSLKTGAQGSSSII